MAISSRMFSYDGGASLAIRSRDGTASKAMDRAAAAMRLFILELASYFP